MTTQTNEAAAGWKPRDTFAARLILIRSERGLTQQEAADQAGLNRGSWAVWESGGSPRRMPQVVASIVEALGVDRDWLMWGGPLSDGEDPDLTPESGRINGRYSVLAHLRPRSHRAHLVSLATRATALAKTA